MEVINKFENKLLNRTEVLGRIAGEGKTPTRYEVISQVAKQMKVEEDLVIVHNISSQYGSSTANIEVTVYNDKETLEKLTPKHILKRNTDAKPAPVEEAPAQEETPEEAPATEEAVPVEEVEAPAEATEEKKEE